MKKITELPFIHFLAKYENHLLSPLEFDGPVSFFAPIQKDDESVSIMSATPWTNQSLQPIKKCLFFRYRFHFSLYLGNGNFLEEHGKKKLFTGVAQTNYNEFQTGLILFFPMFPMFSDQHTPMANLITKDDEIFIPSFKSIGVSMRTITRYKYSGKYKHKDFDHNFVELSPTDGSTFDILLNKFNISIIGCDPHTHYEKPENES